MARALRPQGQSLYGTPAGLTTQAPPPIIAQRAPTSGDTGYSLGQEWVDNAAAASYLLTQVNAGVAVWVATGGGSSALSSLTGNTGTATPTSGNIQIAGGAGVTTSASGSIVTVALTGGSLAMDSFVPDAGTNPVVPTALGAVTMAGTSNQITTTGGLNSLTFSVPSVFVAPGSIAATTSLQANAGGIAGTNTSSGAVVTGSITNLSNTASSDAQFTSVVGGASSGDPYFRATISGVKDWVHGIDNSDSDAYVFSNSGTIGTTNVIRMDAATNIVSFPSASISIPLATTGLVLNPTSGTGAAGGTVNCNGRVGVVTFTGASIAGNATQTLVMGNTSIAGASTRIIFSLIGGLTGTALSIQSYTSSANSVSIVVGNGDGAQTHTGNLTFDFIIVN